MKTKKNSTGSKLSQSTQSLKRHGSNKRPAKKILSVSTKTGDGGQSGVLTGERLPKNHPVFNTVGTLDELNSWLGLVITQMPAELDKYSQQLLEIQETLFYVGAECAGSKVFKLQPEHLKTLETWSSSIQKQMADDWHNKFVLPGGTPLGAYLDLARSVCRRCEREIVSLSQHKQIRDLILRYINRLSDYLYVLRCFANHQVEYQEKFFKSKISL